MTGVGEEFRSFTSEKHLYHTVKHCKILKEKVMQIKCYLGEIM